MMKNRSREDKFLLFISAVLLGFILAYSVCGKADIVQQIRQEAIRQGVNPDIAVAIAKVESNFNSKMLGKKGEIGMFQIMPYHAKGQNLWDQKINISRGVQLLKHCQDYCERSIGPAWIVCYNNGIHRHPKHPLLHPYYRKVMEAMAP